MADIAIVIQARMGSARLPGKVLLPLAGAPALQRMLERVAAVRTPCEVVVAIPDLAADDPIAGLCARLGVRVVRGPHEDVLARYALAVPEHCEVVVRLTGDCPLVDPDLVDRHLGAFRAGGAVDYLSNAVERSYPDGLDVEVVSRAALMRAHALARSAADREHVLGWVRRHGRCGALRQAQDLSALRWTLDTEADYRHVAAIYDELQAGQPGFGRRAVYELLCRRPDLIHTGAPMSTSERGNWQLRLREQLQAEDGAP